MMKKILLLLICCLLAGCAASNDTSDMSAEDIAKDTVASIIAQDYDKACGYFNDDVKQALSVNVLKDAYEQTSAGLSGEGAISDISQNDQGQYLLVCDFEPQDILFTITIQDQKIAGIFMSYTNPTLSLVDNYEFKETAIKVGEYALDGILTQPKTPAKNMPIVLLIQGSGVSDYNEMIGPNKPFEDLAYGLAAKGIASLRYNKRFYQVPESASANYDMHDEYFDDINAAIELIIQEGYDNIYFLGHSQGGSIAHYVAANNDNIDGLILMAGTPRLLIDCMIDQIEAQLVALGSSDIESYMEPYYKAKEEILALENKDEEGMILNLPKSYWYDIKETLPENYLIDIDTLVLQGSEDFQVYPDVDYVMWQELLKDGADYILYDGLNHLFMPSINGDASDYEVASHVDQQVIDDIVNWIKEK